MLLGMKLEQRISRDNTFLQDNQSLLMIQLDNIFLQLMVSDLSYFQGNSSLLDKCDNHQQLLHLKYLYMFQLDTSPLLHR